METRYYVLIILVVIVLIGFSRVRVHIKKNSIETEELLRFFGSKEKLTVSQVSKRILEYTGGRRNVPDFVIHEGLKSLVEDKKLNKEESVSKISVGNGKDFEVTKTIYFLS